MVRARALTAAVFSLGVLVTFVVATVPSIHFAYIAPDLNVAIETSASLIPLLTAYLVYGRAVTGGGLHELLLIAALIILALTNIAFDTLPFAVRGVMTPAAMSWSAVIGRFAGAAIFFASAAVPSGSLPRSREWAPRVAAGSVLFVLLLAVVLAEITPRFPTGISPTESPALIVRLGNAAAWPVRTVQLLTLALFIAAAVGFTRPREGSRDPFLAWLSVASALAACSHLNYFLYPSLYASWVHVGDAFRVGFFAVMLFASIGEIRRYWSSLSRAAALEERRRIARDLHDGLAQELAYIARQARRLSTGDPVVERISSATSRALNESRRAITELNRSTHQSPGDAFADAARNAADRADVSLELTVDIEDVGPSEAEALERIACEAIANAARHGGATRVTVDLSNGKGRTHLIVRDNGRGFEPDRDATSTGYGLRSMRERVASLGGKIRIESAHGDGARVEVTV
jgi:signal transduction histidine kinase